jgi:hypothetical protein
MKKAMVLMLALVIGFSFGAATFVQAFDKPTAPAADEKKDEKKKDEKKGGK